MEYDRNNHLTGRNKSGDSSKKPNTALPHDLAILLLSIYPPQKPESRDSSRYWTIPRFLAVFFKSQKVVTSQIYIDRWIDKQKVVYTYIGILFSFYKEILTHITHRWTLRSYDEQDKSVSKWQTLYDSTYMRYAENLEKSNS